MYTTLYININASSSIFYTVSAYSVLPKQRVPLYGKLETRYLVVEIGLSNAHNGWFDRVHPISELVKFSTETSLIAVGCRK